MLLGRLKIRRWKEWEHEAIGTNYEFANDPSRFRFTHETSFVKAHSSFWTRMTFFFYVGCFFRQFYRSVTKTDYMTLRNGFVTAHVAPGSKFNFQKYIKRSLEDDFKVVVSVSPLLWASFVIFLLLNVNGWHTIFWASILPLTIILAVGTKLQAILAEMALEIKERHAVVQGMPLVQGSDSYFWLSKPQLLLHLLHFSLFQNAFQGTYLLWVLYNFGLYSCFLDKVQTIVTKIVFGVGALVLCSYSTLPLYALVTQMGSHMKKSIFDEQTSNALKRWHMAAKKKQEETSKRSPPQTLGGNSKISKTSFRRHSSGPPLHRFMTIGHSTYSDTYDEHDESNDKHDEQSLLADVGIAVDDDNRECEMTTLPHEEERREEDDTDQLVKPTLGGASIV